MIKDKAKESKNNKMKFKKIDCAGELIQGEGEG